MEYLKLKIKNGHVFGRKTGEEFTCLDSEKELMQPAPGQWSHKKGRYLDAVEYAKAQRRQKRINAAINNPPSYPAKERWDAEKHTYRTNAEHEKYLKKKEEQNNG